MKPKPTINIKNKSNNYKQQARPISKSDPRKVPFYERQFFPGIVVMVLTFIVLFPTLKNGFIPTWDDDYFVTGNTLIKDFNFNSVRLMFTTPVAGAYVPLTLMSLAFDYLLFGLNPVGFHFTNLLLHLLCSFLVFYFLHQLGLKPIYAAFGALLFGIHPMHVESFAWVTERKDLLYGLFFLLSLISYLKYLKEQEKGMKFLVLSLVAFILALFSKIQAVTLPLALLLLDYLFKRPFRLKMMLEKIPFFILSLLFGIVGILMLSNQGALKSNEMTPLFERFIFGFYALGNYLVKFIAPFFLSSFYPVPKAPFSALPILYYLNLLFLPLVVFLVYRNFRQNRVVVFGL
ncbi:MAG: hypothetical protein WCL00_12685, partial [Bacteroidota bacterium]